MPCQLDVDIYDSARPLLKIGRMPWFCLVRIGMDPARLLPRSLTDLPPFFALLTLMPSSWMGYVYACLPLYHVIRSLAEARMEALERENNAREVLGMNVGNGSSSGSNSKNNTGDDDDDDNQQENEQAGRGGEDADADEEETAASAAVSHRLVAMKHAVEIKVWCMCGTIDRHGATGG